MNTFSSSEQGVVLVLDAEGKKQGKSIKTKIIDEHDDAYFFTAAAIVAYLKQYFDGALNKPGVWLMGNFADNFRLMKDMENMGINIREEITNGNGGT